MLLRVLGSGSSGNCYLLETDYECLVIEAGIPFKEVKIALDFDISKIVGVVVSHIHSDHYGRCKEFEDAGIKVFKPFEKHEKVVHFGGFTIQPFELVHDVPCFGFYISHEEMGKLIFLTDTEYCKYVFRNVNHIMCEANYSPELISDGDSNYTHRVRGHMSIDTTLDFIKANNNMHLKNVILTHLSDSASDADSFIERVEKIADCPVCVAEKGLVLNVTLIPFL